MRAGFGSQAVAIFRAEREHRRHGGGVGRPYPADAIVITPSADLVRVPVAARALMSEHPALAAAYTASVVEHTQALHEKIRIMSAEPTDKRLATLLLYLARRW
ncbi:MAG: hypothetical protein U0235_12375 [Polyangiaceae bacterium]